MKLCEDCGVNPVSKSTYHRCWACARARYGGGSDLRYIDVGESIRAEARLYGYHKRCRTCDEACKCAAVPGSRIVYCPKHPRMEM